MSTNHDDRAATRLGRAIRATTEGAAVTAGHREAHRQNN